MAACKNCGRQVSNWDLNDLGLCTQCTQEKTLKEREDRIRLLGSGPHRCQLVLTDFVIPSRVTWVSIGDLFACESGLVFIYLAGDIKQQFLNTQTHSLETRQKDFGLTLEDRIRQHEGVAIPKQEIIAISQGGSKTTLVIEYKGGVLALGHDKAAECIAQLLAWQRNTLGEYKDIQGVNLNIGLPSVDQFVSWLVNGQILSEIDPSKLAEIPSRASYVQNILHSFDRLKYHQKTACIASIFSLKVVWKNIFLKYLKEKKLTAQLAAFGFGLGCSLLIGGGIYFISDYGISFDAAFLGLALFLTVCLIGVGAGFIINLSDIRELNRLLALFRQKG